MIPRKLLIICFIKKRNAKNGPQLNILVCRIEVIIAVNPMCATGHNLFIIFINNGLKFHKNYILNYSDGADFSFSFIQLYP